MAEQFSTFVMSETTFNQINVLPDDLQLKFYRAVSNYGIYGIEPKFTGIELALWIPMRDLILNSKQKNEEWLKKQRENGKKGAEKRWQCHSKNSGAIMPNSENSHNDNDNVNVNDNDNVNESGASAPLDSADEPPQSLQDALELSTLLLTTHRAEIPDYLSGKDKQTIPRWAQDIEKLIRIDKKEPEIIQQVILWVKTPGNFWFHNIESGKKLREKFERLYGQMLSGASNTGPPNVTGDVSNYFEEVG